MAPFSPAPAYILGTACIARGAMAILSPQKEYAHVGLPLESRASSSRTAQPQDDPESGSVSPLMYFKGIREISYGATMIALQQQGYEGAFTTFAAILSVVRFSDGLVVWLHGGEKLKWNTVGHWITGIGFAGWVLWRQSYR